MRKRGTYRTYSIGCAVAWAVLWLAVLTLDSAATQSTVLLIFIGWVIGWTSATIARPVYPPSGANQTDPLASGSGPRRVHFAAVYTLFGVLQVIISVVLIFLVLLHSGKDAGLSGAFGIGGGGSAFGGGSMVERNLDRATVFFASSSSSTPSCC